MHACRKLVENVIFFRNLPLNLLVRIISCLRIEVFLVNDVIIRVNTPGSSMYFISTGTVAIYTKSGKEVCIYEYMGRYKGVPRSSRLENLVKFDINLKPMGQFG